MQINQKKCVESLNATFICFNINRKGALCPRHTKGSASFWSCSVCYLLRCSHDISYFSRLALHQKNPSKSNSKRWKNRWRGVTISLRTGGQEHTTPIYTLPHSMLTHTHKRLDHHWPTDQRTDGQTNGPTDQRTDKASYIIACPQLKTKPRLKLVESTHSTHVISRHCFYTRWWRMSSFPHRRL